jgi:hypothetical protein
MRPTLKSRTKSTQSQHYLFSVVEFIFVTDYSGLALFAPGDMNIIKPRANLRRAEFAPFFAVSRLLPASMHKYSCAGANTLVG